MVTDVGSTPVVQTSGGCGDGFGGMGWWGFLILAMMFWGVGGGGWGGRGMGGPALMGADSAAAAEAVKSTVWQAQDMGQTQDQIRGISYGLSELGYSLNNTIGSVGSKVDNAAYALNTGILNSKFETSRDIAGAAAGISGAVNGLAWQLADRINGINGQLCCLGKQIDAVNYANALNTNAINANVTMQTQRVLDAFNCNEKARLNQELSDSKMALMEARLIAAQKPVAPIPAYTVQSPYASSPSAAS